VADNILLYIYYLFLIWYRYQTGLAIRESDTRKTLEKLRKRQTCMLLKLPQEVGQLGKFKDSKEYHPLVKVCMAFSRHH